MLGLRVGSILGPRAGEGGYCRRAANMRITAAKLTAGHQRCMYSMVTGFLVDRRNLHICSPSIAQLA